MCSLNRQTQGPEAQAKRSDRLKILQVSTEDNSGGASRSAYRLQQALLQENIDSSMRVLSHQTANSRVIAGRAARTLNQKIKDKLAQQWWNF
jgi:hypothetical protein